MVSPWRERILRHGARRGPGTLLNRRGELHNGSQAPELESRCAALHSAQRRLALAVMSLMKSRHLMRCLIGIHRYVGNTNTRRCQRTPSSCRLPQLRLLGCAAKLMNYRQIKSARVTPAIVLLGTTLWELAHELVLCSGFCAGFWCRHRACLPHGLVLFRHTSCGAHRFFVWNTSTSLIRVWL